jgi:hypothetical protein
MTGTLNSHRISRRSAAVVGAAILWIACSSTTTLPPSGPTLALGTWGGDSAGMIVSDTAMHIHIGCTYGDVSGLVPVGSDGAIDISGRYLLRAYPIAIGPTLPARFTGRQSGSTATITVTVTDTVQNKTVVLGPVIVIFGKTPRLIPCPICRRPIMTRGLSR